MVYWYQGKREDMGRQTELPGTLLLVAQLLQRAVRQINQVNAMQYNPGGSYIKKHFMYYCYCN
ncbi:hypothetical protein GGP41_001587 [Bipolaris sorokiniana]|uniref:Uncharacterized protein n=1 Tax=Cochliobolus sativus TaxID=45130 RepID=A0A8H6E039_COCSA|nr:hypothetical protein GGP41_001587 [Bipolaris sorokiniana]